VTRREKQKAERKKQKGKRRKGEWEQEVKINS